MDNQPSNFWDDLEKWFKLPAGDEPHGDSATNIGGLGSTDKPKIAWKSIPETESIATIDGSGMSIATTTLPGLFPGSQSGVGGDTVNELGAAIQHGTKSNQGSRGVTLYPPLPVGVGGPRADLEITPNSSGLGANMPTYPYVTERSSDGGQTMRWTQPPTNSASVHHLQANKHTNNSFGAVTLAGISGPTTGAEGINGSAIMVPLSSLNDPFTTYLTMDGMHTVPGPIFANGADPTLGESQPTISQDESHMEREAAAGVYEGSPQNVASGALANKPNHELPTATGRWRGPLPLLPVDPEDDLTRLKDDLVENGADVEAVNSCDEVFKDGISKEALQKPLTRKQCKRLHLRTGKQFQRFLEKVQVDVGTKNRCRLCPGNDAVLYKGHRDALRHFHKDHFGLWFECTNCGYKAFTNPELTKHVKIKHSAIRDDRTSRNFS